MKNITKKQNIMTTIFVINGGGQKVRQNVQNGIPVTYELRENSDYVEKSKCNGVNSYTNEMWSTDLEDLKIWASEWANEDVELILE